MNNINNNNIINRFSYNYHGRARWNLMTLTLDVIGSTSKTVGMTAGYGPNSVN